MNSSWFDGSIMYQFFPLGLCGAPHENSWDWTNTWNAATRPVRRIDRVLSWIDQMKSLGVNTVFFNPVSQSDTHGYNTRDFYTLDSRLGSNEDFTVVCQTLHDNGFRIVLDTMFHSVGRGFWAFRDVRANLQKSQYVDWFKEIDFNANTPCNDGFYYKAWNDNWDLPELNLENENVIQHLFGAVRKWEELFRFDGLRIGVVEKLPEKFLGRLKTLCSDMNAGLGGSIAFVCEVVYGYDYRKYVAPGLGQSATNYEFYRAVCSSFNDANFFQLSYTLNRQFGIDGLFKDIPLMNFLDNHDVPRFAHILKDKNLIRLGWGILFGVPGFPCIYYGSEWGYDFYRPDDHWGMRPAFEQPEHNELTGFIEKITAIRKSSPALKYGSYREIFVTKETLMFERISCGEKIIVALNLSDYDYNVHPETCSGYGAFEGIFGTYTDLISGEKYSFDGSIVLLPKSVLYLKCTPFEEV